VGANLGLYVRQQPASLGKAMADKSEDLDEIETLLFDVLKPKDDLPTSPLNLEAHGMQIGSMARAAGHDNMDAVLKVGG
jgi:hypothetical protein